MHHLVKLNIVNNKIYVGKSIDFISRKYSHIDKLSCLCFLEDCGEDDEDDEDEDCTGNELFSTNDE